MKKFWKKQEKGFFCPKGTLSFIEWAGGKDILPRSAESLEQTQKLLVEIQKRSLADQVLLLSCDRDSEQCKLIGISPSREKPAIHQRVQFSLINKCLEEKRILVWEDLWRDELMREQLRHLKCKSLLLAPLNLDQKMIDVLAIVNYSSTGKPSRVIDFITFISSVLALSIQNVRLYSALKQKDTELKDWVTDVEKRIEEGTKQLLEREFQYYKLFEETNDGIIVHDGDGNLIEINHVLCKLLNYEKRELLSLNWNQLCPSEVLDDQISFFKQILNHEPVVTLETVLQKKDGTIFQAEISSHRVWFRGNEVIQSVVRDISKRKKIEENLRETKGRYRIFLDASRLGMFVIQGGVIQYVNDMFKKMVGRSEEELLDQPFFHFVAPEDRNRVVDCEMRREKGENIPDKYEMRIITRKGEKCWVEVHLRLIFIDGKATILGNMIDITHKKYIESHKFEIQKMESITTLAGGVAHDFNNLLGGILGYASLILSDMPKDNVYYEDVRVIAETAKKAADLTSRLLAFARGGKYQVKSVNVNRVIDDMLSVLSRTMDPAIIVEKDFEQNLWQMEGDSQQIYDAILNICLNARDALPNGGKIRIETTNQIIDKEFEKTHLDLVSGDYIRITISDTGVGMSDVTKSRMFEPFFTTKLARDGAGLGLAMVYGVVKNHGGVIFAESELDKGTKITIYFPRYVKEKLVISKKQTAKLKRSNRILLVDDEEIIRQVGKRMLEKGGYEVLLANNGREALTLFEKYKNEIDLVLLDLIMPVMGGKETYRRLKEIDPHVLVILTSGYGPYGRKDFYYLGDEYFIQKPFQTDVLIQAVQDLLGVSQQNK
ncbi:PAS domain S-box protein [bacterium]|nr:PAS domain S-box protein [bacterium]RQV95065.1 MAG: PAS domain S-box protein [bacterium]